MTAPKTLDPVTPPKGRARLEARVASEKKERYERAAALEGRSLTDFIVTHLDSAADEVINHQHRITLSARGAEAFVALLLNPPEPNEHLRAAFEFRRQALVK